jgi:hypothetical protein
MSETKAYGPALERKEARFSAGLNGAGMMLVPAYM